MGRLLLQDLDDDLVDALKARAERHRRSVEAEHRAILVQALRGESESFLDAARRVRARTDAGSGVRSEQIIRADRDRDDSADSA